MIASFGEIFGVLAIKLYLQKRNWLRLFLLIATFGFGFFFLALAMRDIQLSTAYAVWTGLGAAGAVALGIVFFAESAHPRRLFFLAFIITGAVGLRIVG